MESRLEQYYPRGEVSGQGGGTTTRQRWRWLSVHAKELEGREGGGVVEEERLKVKNP